MKKTLLFIITFYTSSIVASDVVLKDIFTTVKNGKSTIEYTFSDRVEPRKVALDFINDTIQLDVPQAFIEEKKRFTNVEDDKIKNLYSYQVDKNTLRLRINYKAGTSTNDFQGNVNTAFEGNKFIVTINDGRAPLKADTNLPEKKSLNVVKVEDLTGEETGIGISPAIPEVVNEASGKVEASKDIAALSEKEIPVLQASIGKEAKKSSSFLFRVMSSFAILGLFAFGMYLLNRRWSKTRFKNPHTHIKVLTQHYIGPKKSLAIIRVAGESILIGVTENNINLIKELSLLEEDIPQNVPDKFETSMSEASYDLEVEENVGATEQDTFSISGIKDIVKSRLKTMREL